ncbi:TPM domain-containing protein [Thermomonas sp.]|uniref:TPM domain-containing protein n=1 Tax=Thermomonas sp. TaxID=1971895 RepID=UPI0035AFCFCD
MAGTLKRLFTHLFTADARGLFPPAAMERIAAAIDIGETCHAGEVCFAVEASLPWRDVLRGVQARARAEEAFARLRVWDTAANNGVLIYLLLADHRIEIVADRGLRPFVSAEQWRGVCELMEGRLRAGEHADGVVAGIEAVGDLLAEHFPQEPGTRDEDELPDQPVFL